MASNISFILTNVIEYDVRSFKLKLEAMDSNISAFAIHCQELWLKLIQSHSIFVLA